ncbi:MAG: phosphate signaling complex protein PhoU [Desulfotalea sp.]
MTNHYTFQHELNEINRKIMQMAILAEDRVRRAMAVVERRDEAEAQNIIKADYEIDDLEVEVEEDCLKLLALHQPVAGDLRFIIAVIKINNELERIADIAVNIARCVKAIQENEDITTIVDYSDMSLLVIYMLKQSIDALVNRNSTLARKIFFLDDDVDNLFRESCRMVNSADKSHRSGFLINVYLVGLHLERIADRATNIAEEVIHLVEGDIVRS